ncbi:extracellular solute-binding protein [Actinomadura craniellae]|nr:extracellular solute-binding protein [Actinomadura craniellae]
MREPLGRRRLMIAAALGALAGCTEAAPPAGGPARPARIRWFASSITDSRQDLREPLVNAFQRAHPLIRIEVVSGPMNTDEKRSWIRDTIARKGHDLPPDVYLGDIIWPAEFAANHLAAPLDRHFPPSFWNRFPQELVAATVYGGKSYSVPFFADQSVLMYRKDLLAEAGADGPPRTWEELSELARRLVREGRVEHGFVWQGVAYEGLMCVWAEFAAHARAEMALSPAGTGLRVDSPEALDALRFMRRMLTDGTSPAAVTTFRETQALQVFESGQAAFLRTWNPEISELNLPVRGKVGVAPLPTFDGRPESRASVVGGWSLFVNPRTEHLDEVRAFIDWITDFPAQYTVAQYSKIPVNAAVRADAIVRGNPALAATTASRPVRRPASTPRYPQVSQIVYTEIHRALTGAVPPERALREAQRRIDRLLPATAP